MTTASGIWNNRSSIHQSQLWNGKLARTFFWNEKWNGWRGGNGRKRRDDNFSVWCFSEISINIGLREQRRNGEEKSFHSNIQMQNVRWSSGWFGGFIAWITLKGKGEEDHERMMGELEQCWRMACASFVCGTGNAHLSKWAYSLEKNARRTKYVWFCCGSGGSSAAN